MCPCFLVQQLVTHTCHVSSRKQVHISVIFIIDSSRNCGCVKISAVTCYRHVTRVCLVHILAWHLRRAYLYKARILSSIRLLWIRNLLFPHARLVSIIFPSKLRISDFRSDIFHKVPRSSNEYCPEWCGGTEFPFLKPRILRKGTDRLFSLKNLCSFASQRCVCISEWT